MTDNERMLAKLQATLDSLSWKLNDLAAPSFDTRDIEKGLEEIDSTLDKFVEMVGDSTKADEAAERITGAISDSAADLLGTLIPRIDKVIETGERTNDLLEQLVGHLGKLASIIVPTPAGPALDAEKISAPGAIARLAERTAADALPNGDFGDDKEEPVPAVESELRHPKKRRRS